MEDLFYPMIFKRKSFHLFREIQSITTSELKDIEAKFKALKPLVDDIKTDIRIVPAEETSPLKTDDLIVQEEFFCD